MVNQIYIASVVEVIRYQNKPTLELRIRVPTIHGNMTKVQDLPIAKPIMMPGVAIDWVKFLDHLTYINKVYVIFDGGNYSRPMYLGVVNDSVIFQPDLYENIGEGDNFEEVEVSETEPLSEDIKVWFKLGEVIDTEEEENEGE